MEINELQQLDRDIRKTLLNYTLARDILQEWVNKQGHERCWYYPDIFSKLCKYLEVEENKIPLLPPKEEFRENCQKYEAEQYEPEYMI